MAEKPKIDIVRFTQHVQEIRNIIANDGVQASFVGGIAVRAIQDKEPAPTRSNGTITDLDIVAIGPDPERIKLAQDDVARYRASFFDCPPVSLESVRFSNLPKRHYPLEVFSGIRCDSNGRYFLTFRSVEQEIDPATISLITRNFGEAKIETFPQETVLQRYYVRMGYLKPKDITKVEELRKYIEDTGGDHIDPKLYLPYIEFCQQVQEKHHRIVRLTKSYWDFDQKKDGKFSGSSGLLYKTIDIFRH